MRSIKIMLLGIALMLVALYIPHEGAFRTGGYEIYLLGLGFILVIIGFFKKIRKKINKLTGAIVEQTTVASCAKLAGV